MEAVESTEEAYDEAINDQPEKGDSQNMATSLKHTAFLIYLVALHVLLVFALIKTDLIPRAAIRLGLSKPTIPDMEPVITDRRFYQQESDRFIPTGTTIFLGDSIISGLPKNVAASIASPAVDYGIGWQRSDQLIKSMDSYDSIKRSGQIIIMIGTNDILQGTEQQGGGLESRYKTILEKIPSNIPVVLSSVPPIGAKEWLGRTIEDTNVRQAVLSAKHECDPDPRCRFVNAYDALTNNGAPIPGVLLNDGIHLTPYGYELWAKSVRQSLTPKTQ
jgi:hypothetical protein